MWRLYSGSGGKLKGLALVEKCPLQLGAATIEDVSARKLIAVIGHEFDGFVAAGENDVTIKPLVIRRQQQMLPEVRCACAEGNGEALPAMSRIHSPAVGRTADAYCYSMPPEVSRDSKRVFLAAENKHGNRGVERRARDFRQHRRPPPPRLRFGHYRQERKLRTAS